ncbi:2031_t:CDS:2, partial [Paraglomus occultum]
QSEDIIDLEDYYRRRSSRSETKDIFDIDNIACSKCGNKRTSLWCNDCERRYFKLAFSTWTSGNKLVDKFVQDIQINAQSCAQYIEWIPFDRLTIISYVASGGSARTFLAKWKDGPLWKFDKKTGRRVRSGPRNVIVKQIKNGVELTSEYLNELKSYFKCVSWDDHLLHYFGITRDPSTEEYAVVVEYAKLGSLLDYLYKDTNLTWSRRLSILNDIALGLYNIHAKNVIHGDIHSGNVLIYDSKKSRKGNGDIYTVISDLGLSRSILRSPFSLDQVYGILPYIAPEILIGGDQTISSDIYSFGHIMYVLSTGRQPFADYLYDKSRLALSICGGLRPNIPADTPADYAILMRQCWDAEPSRRPDAFDLVTRIGTIRRTLSADEVVRRLVRKGRTSRVDEIDDGCKSSWVDVSTLRGTITLR